VGVLIAEKFGKPLVDLVGVGNLADTVCRIDVFVTPFNDHAK